jgi:glycosyltransferase involved in cell wall biosynthesis
VIVVDGGSQDRTLEIARDHGVRTIVSSPGRGTGICIGAEEARGGSGDCAPEASMGDRGFESISLHRRVNSEPDFLDQA